MPSSHPRYNILIIGQKGRIGYEALLFAASLRQSTDAFAGRLFVAEPQPGPLWDHDPRMPDALKTALRDLGAQIMPFEARHFGQSYPQGNKIEGLRCLPAGEPFVFFDSDTLITGDLARVTFDFNRPAASMNRSATWPVERLYWPGYTAVWASLYDRFALDFETSLDKSQPDEDWQRYLYFNAGWFYGADPAEFAKLFAEYATEIRDHPPAALQSQPLYPWLDQIALPLVIHRLGGGRPRANLAGLDGDISFHYRAMPLFYTRAHDWQVALLETIAAPNRIKKQLKQHDPFKYMIYHGRGRKLRAEFDRTTLPHDEKTLRNQIRAKGFWMR